MPHTTLLDPAYAAQLDLADPLAHFRREFIMDEPGFIYLDGNSLGRLPRATPPHLEQLITHAWGRRLVRGWNEGWIDLPQRVGAKIAGLIGADPAGVLVADSTSVNFYKLALAALQWQRRQHPHKQHVLTDDLNFPSDLYVLQAVVNSLPGLRLEVTPTGAEDPAEAILARLGPETALLTLSHTTFKSGYTYDVERMTRAAQAVGALVVWDLSHSVGVVPIDLSAAQADGAVGCTYKYLNGGPGAPAFIYVRPDWQTVWQNPVAGWMGQEDMFAFEPRYRPKSGISRFLTGTPPILSLAAIEVGVDLVLAAGVPAIRAKSVRQSEFLIGLWAEVLQPLGFSLNSPRLAERRGSHISLGHPEAFRIDLALIHAMQLLPDFRRPDNLRLGIAPLYNSFADLQEAARRLQRVVTEGVYRRYTTEGWAVT